MDSEAGALYRSWEAAHAAAARHEQRRMERAADLADVNAELVDQALLLLRTLLANKSPEPW